MTITLDLPPQVEEAYLAEAEARGLRPADLVLESSSPVSPQIGSLN